MARSAVGDGRGGDNVHHPQCDILFADASPSHFVVQQRKMVSSTTSLESLHVRRPESQRPPDNYSLDVMGGTPNSTPNSPPYVYPFLGPLVPNANFSTFSLKLSGPFRLALECCPCFCRDPFAVLTFEVRIGEERPIDSSTDSFSSRS